MRGDSCFLSVEGVGGLAPVYIASLCVRLSLFVTVFLVSHTWFLSYFWLLCMSTLYFQNWGGGGGFDGLWAGEEGRGGVLLGGKIKGFERKSMLIAPLFYHKKGPGKCFLALPCPCSVTGVNL